MSRALIGLTVFVAFVLVVACTITVFYAAIHAININSQINVFFAGLLTLLIGIVAGPLFCLIGNYGLVHYWTFTDLGAALLVTPVLLAWCYMVYSMAAGYLRG